MRLFVWERPVRWPGPKRRHAPDFLATPRKALQLRQEGSTAHSAPRRYPADSIPAAIDLETNGPPKDPRSNELTRVPRTKLLHDPGQGRTGSPTETLPKHPNPYPKRELNPEKTQSHPRSADVQSIPPRGGPPARD